MRLPVALLALVATVPASSTKRNPLNALSAVQNASIHTHSHQITALSEFQLSFGIRDNILIRLHLEPNHDILGADATITHLAPDGSAARKESVDRLQHKVFRGTAWMQIETNEWRRVGWARIVMLRDGRHPMFEGAFSVNHDHHHILSSTNYRRTKHPMDPGGPDGDEYMVVWRDSDILQYEDLRRDLDESESCRADQLSFNTRSEHPVYRAMQRRTYGSIAWLNVFQRQVESTTSGNSPAGNLVATIGQTKGCPSTRKVALVGAAADCTYISQFDSSESARENIIQQFNTASEIWERAFNISLGLQNLAVMDASCPRNPTSATSWNQACSDAVDIVARLNLFSEWRGKQHDNNSHWTLLTACNTGSAVGLAWLGQACVQEAVTLNSSVTGNGASTSSGPQTVAGANVVVRTHGTSEWQIIAHETAHTYGAVHDCTSATCSDATLVAAQQCCPSNPETCDADQNFLMNPQARPGVRAFSPCSIGNVCSALRSLSVDARCLTSSNNISTLTPQQCGNGIVEPGEDCDCGPPETCSSSCCDPRTCTFTPSSACDSSSSSCCTDCAFSPPSTVCRASTGLCDPPEFCTGTSSSCPRDLSSPDGTFCAAGLSCASGQCTSRNEQCRSASSRSTNSSLSSSACDQASCVLSCSDPSFGSGCYSLRAPFLDGTPCAGNGRCLNGSCVSADAGRSWIDAHRTLIIALTCALGGFLLLLALVCCVCVGRRRQRGGHGGNASSALTSSYPSLPSGGIRYA